MSDLRETAYECVDPSVGSQLWRLEEAGVEPEIRARLEAHLEVCHACRLVAHLDRRMRALARAGELQISAPSRPSGRLLAWRGRMIGLAGLTAGASLALALILPPRPAGDLPSHRGGDGTKFERPVEGEVVPAGPVSFRWTPVPGASRYRLELRDEDGRQVWSGETATPGLRSPEAPALSRGRRYKATLDVQPADLLPPGRISVAFRPGSGWDVASHRLRFAHPLLQAATLLSSALLLLFAFGRLRR